MTTLALAALAAALLVGAGWLWIRWWDARRRGQMAALAASMGLAYSPDDPVGISDRYDGIRAIGRGFERRAFNVIRGEFRGREVLAFDYICKTVEQGGKSRQTHHFSAVLVPCACQFPRLLLRPEGLTDRLAGAFGSEDIDFESHEFSRRWYVSGPDRKFAYQVVHPEMMEHLLANPGWIIELGGPGAAIHTESIWKVERFGPALEVLAGFLDRVPDYVWKDYAAKEAAPDVSR
jgi:hypothetical protein